MAKRPVAPDDLLRFAFVGDAQFSPGGEAILFTKRVIEKNQYIANLFSVDLKGKLRQWTQGKGGAGSGRWSPDGTWIAFVSGREKPSSQIYRIAVDGGEAEAVTQLPEGSLGAIAWSPDSTKIAFAFRPTSAAWTKQAVDKRKEENLADPPWVLETPWYRYDGDGYFGEQRYSLYVVDLASGQTREVHREPLTGHFDFDWSPDSKELAIMHTANKRPWVDKPNDQIWRLNLATGKAKKLPGLPRGEKYGVKWSPNGKLLAYLGTDREEDPWGVNNTQAFVVSSDGGSPRCLTDSADFCLGVGTLSDSAEAAFGGALTWSPDSARLFVQIGWHGEGQLGVVDVRKGGITLATSGRHVISVGGAARDGKRVACVFATATSPPEVGWLDLSGAKAKLNQLTKLNQALFADLDVAEPEEVWLDTPDGAKVHTWVLTPKDAKKRKNNPAVLQIHGGPHAQYGWTFFHEFQVLVAEGYVVVYSNPRGSKGYGEAHCKAIQGSWGDRDWVDVQAVAKWMRALPYVDSKRVGVMGGSYGGYMTNWAVGHTKEFRAAITDRCVSNLVSMGGSSDFPNVPDTYWRGSCFGDLKAIETLWKQSPLAYFDKVETPMLIIHSEGDLRCNVEQAEQVFSALQVRGIESRFVRYPRSTSHGLSRMGPPDLRLHRLGEILRWWSKHLR